MEDLTGKKIKMMWNGTMIEVTVIGYDGDTILVR